MQENLTFLQYQKFTKNTAIYEDITNKLKIPQLLYLALGLAGESGEISDKIKKLLRNNNGKITKDFIESIAKELGDLLWYISEISRQLGLSLETVAKMNIAKINDRLHKGTIKGEGDER